jgi:hypothetical protein
MTTDDPKTKELVDEIVMLSTEFGILTEYTAFLAREGTNFEQPEILLEEASDMLRLRAVMKRSGKSAVSQSYNIGSQKYQSQLNARNTYYGTDMERLTISNVQQINDRAYYYRNNRWVDSRLLKDEANIKPKRIIEFGSPEFIGLVTRLSLDNQQGCIALGGNVLFLVDGETVLVKAPTVN